MRPSGRIIFHIDFDSFFASVEQEDHPHLQGKPIGVTATNGRTCIIASSREAKRFGVKTATRTFDALKMCPEIQLVPANFPRYWEISKKFIAICKDFTPYVEVFSIDELFMDATLTSHLFGGVPSLVKKIKDRIRDEVGLYITVSVGISHNKLLAKLASGLKKPNGVFLIQPYQVESVYRVAQLTDMCGIGSRIQRRLNMMGIYTLLQLRKVPLSPLVAEFGNVEGHFLKNVGLGLDISLVKSYTEVDEVKSVGRNYCLPHNEYDKRIVLQNIYELCEEIAIKLRRLQKKAKTAGVGLRGQYEIYGRKTFSTHMYTGQEIFEAVLYTINRSLPEGYTRQIGVWVSNLMDEKDLPSPLFGRNMQNPKLLQAIDTINDKFGDHTIRNGFLLYADKLTTVPNGYMADRYERMKLATTAL